MTASARPSGRAQPRAVRAFVAAACVPGVVLAVAVTARRPPHAPLAWLGVLVGLTIAGEALRFSLRLRRGTIAHNLTGCFVLAAAFFYPGVPAVALAVVSQVAVSLWRRNPPVKATFNAGLMGTAAGIVSAAEVATHHAGSLGASTFAALLGATLVVAVVNLAALACVLALADGGSFAANVRSLAAPVLFNWVVNANLAVLFVPAFRWNPLLTAAFPLPLLVLHWASRGYAMEQANKLRVEGMQRVTHALTVASGTQAAVEGFLRELVRCIPHEGAELFTVRDDGWSRRRYDAREDSYASYDGLSGTEPLLQAVIGARGVLDSTAAPTLSEEVRRALLSQGWQDVLAVTLRADNVAGVLCLFNRQGSDVVDSASAAVLDALTAELGAVLDKAALFDSLVSERGKLAQIVESTTDGIITLTADGAIASWNAGMEHITGYGATDMVGTRHLGVLRPRDAAGRDVLLQGLPDSVAELPEEIQVMTSDGHTCWLSCSYSPVPATGSLVVVARNVTQVRELERLKDDFIAVVSHELRTPLATIKGWAATMVSRGDRMTPQQRADGVQGIYRQAQRLEQLVMNILEASRIEAGSVAQSTDVVDVAMVVERTVVDARAAYPGRQVLVAGTDTAQLVRGREVWVGLALSNLVANALKYSPPDSVVEVTVRRQGDDVALAVSDRGPGIAAEARERVFQRFERLSETPSQTGTGLGLYISRQVVAAMGGSVGVEERPGGGSVFVVRLPAVDLRLDEPPVPRPREQEPRTTAERPIDLAQGPTR